MTKDPTPIRSFTELVAWQKARVVRKAIAALVLTWPPEEKHRLTDQVVRSSRATCANIAEGYGRFREKDNVRFCRMGRSSLYETQDHLSAAFDEGYSTPAVLKAHWAMVEEAIKILNGYIAYLRRMGSNDEVAEPVVAYGVDNALFDAAPDEFSSDGLLAGLPGSQNVGTDNGQPTTDN